MKDLTENQRKNLRLLEMSFGEAGERGELLAGGANPALCASLIREERTQYKFMVIYQVIILTFSLIVFVLLALAAWKIARGTTVEGLLAGAGALVSGTAAAYLMKQRSDARDVHAAAQAGLDKYKCPKDF